MMLRISITKEQIIKCAEDSKYMGDYIVNLHKLVIPDPFEKIVSFNTWPQINAGTSSFILEQAYKKWDVYTVNCMWLNKGFSSFHNELKDWEVVIPNNCYELYTPEHVELVDMTAGFAKVEVEEIGEDPSELWIDTEHDFTQ